MKLLLFLNKSGRIIMAEHSASGLLVFRHDNESESAFLDRAREQVQKLFAGRT